MTRDEYLAVLATEPATGTQVGAILGEFARLGVGDRAERLAISAELLELDRLGSTTDLVMGDAGRLVGILRRTRDRAELPEIITAADGDGQADEHVDDDRAGSEGMTLGEAIVRIAVLLYVAWQKKELADIGLNIGQLCAKGSFISAPDDSSPAHKEGIPGDRG